MTDVNVTLLQQRMQEYLARADAGETIRVTLHNRVIVEFSPAPEPYMEAGAAVRERLRGSLLRYDYPLKSAVPASE